MLDQTQAIARGDDRAQPSKTRVFISYSRADVAFARRLVAALEARGIEAKIDERDLPALEDWKRELLAFIRGADTVVFIVSPRSIASAVCEWEVAQVAALDKRLAPVVLERVADDKIPAAIARINYLFFDPPNDFETQAYKLATALLTDADWLRDHTRLSELARRWEADERPNAQLLRSAEIDRTAAWVERRSQTAPAIPDALREFLAAGRKFEQETRDHLRRTAGRAFVKPAEEALKEGRHDRALRLAAAGALLANDLEFEVVPELWGPAAQATFESKTTSILRGHNDVVTIASFSMDGRRIITGSSDKTARIWDPQTGKCLALLKDHEAAVTSAAFSADGRLIATSSKNSTRVWDTATGQQMAILGPSLPVQTSSFSTDGLRVVTAFGGNVARVWDVAKGIEIGSLRTSIEEVRSAVFSPDGHTILTASGGNTLRVWAADTLERIAAFEANQFKERLIRAEFSADGRRIMATLRDQVVRILDTQTMKEIIIRTNHVAEVNSVVLSRNGDLIVTASNDNTAQVWDARAGTKIADLRGHQDVVRTAFFSCDGGRAVTASADGTARVWDARSGKEITVLYGHSVGLTNASFNPDGRLIVTASLDGTGRVWDAASGLTLTAFQSHALRTRKPSSYEPATSQEREAERSKPFKPRSFKVVQQHFFSEGQSQVTHATFNPDGSRIVVPNDDNTARVWDFETGDDIALLKGHEGAVNNAAFSPDGRWIVTASEDRTARIWDAETGAAIRILQGDHNDEMYFETAYFTPDGARIVTASAVNGWRVLYGDSPGGQPGWWRRPWSRAVVEHYYRIRVWDAATGAEIVSVGPFYDENSKIRSHSATVTADGCRVLARHGWETLLILGTDADDGITLTGCSARDIGGAQFSPDGSRIVTVSGDGTLRTWDVGTGNILAVLNPHGVSLNSVAFRADGRLMVTASSDNTAQVLDLASGENIALLKGHEGAVNSAVFSRDGSRIVTASDDESARIWDAQTGKQLACLNGHGAAVTTALFSPDACRVITVSDDGIGAVWDISRTAVVRHGRCVAFTAALGHGIGWRAAAEKADLLMQDAEDDLYAEALKQLGRPADDLGIEKVAAALRVSLHPNCYLSPTQLAEKCGLAPPAASRATGTTEAAEGEAAAQDGGSERETTPAEGNGANDRPPAAMSPAHPATGTEGRSRLSAESAAKPARHHRRAWVLWLALVCAVTAAALAGLLALGPFWR